MVWDDDLFGEALEEFLHQIRNYGWYDSVHDPGWMGYEGVPEAVDLICESRWAPAWKDHVPSRLWDKETPTVMVYISAKAIR